MHMLEAGMSCDPLRKAFFSVLKSLACMHVRVHAAIMALVNKPEDQAGHLYSWGLPGHMLPRFSRKS